MALITYSKTFTVASGVAADAVSQLAFNRSDVRQYGPFNAAVIYNPSGQDIGFRPNNFAEDIVIVAGGALFIEPEDGVVYDRASIHNRDAAAATDTAITIEVRKVQ